MGSHGCSRSAGKRCRTKSAFFCFFFPLQIYQIPRCLTLKQRLQTLPTSRPEISQVGSQLLVLSPLHGAGGGAGQQQGMGVLVLLLVCALAQRAAVGVGFSETPMVCVFDKMLFVGWAGTFRGGRRATRVPCGGHQDGSQAVGLGRGPSPFPWQGSGALAELLLWGGSCWDRRAGVTCWALAPGCAPCFLSRLPATEPLKIPNKAWLN